MLPSAKRHFANVRFWHKADNPTTSAFVRYWSNSEHWSGRVMGKMGVGSVAELVRMTEKLSWQSGEIMNSLALKANSTNGFILKQ